MSTWIDDDAEWLEATYPEHDRDSCSDADLYNASSVRLRSRCDRCEALWQMKAKAAIKELATLKGKKS